MIEISIDPRVDSIEMPENLRVGLLVAEQHKKCKRGKCLFDYAGFAFGQSPFHVPESLEKALSEHADKGHYSAAEGIFELREAIAGFNHRYFKLDYDPSRIIVGPGTKDLIFSIFTIFSGHAIIPTPSWIGYLPQLKLLGKDYHIYYLKPQFNYKIQPDHLDTFLLEIAHDKKQHLLVINNPHNPTGVLYTRQELTEIAEVCRRHNTLILSDEIYALSTYRFEDFTSMGVIYPEGTFVTNGLSKDRSAGGYRLGSCVLPVQHSDKLMRDFKKVAATVYTNVSTPTQHAAIKVYESNTEIDEYFTITREIHRMMGSFMSKAFNNIEGIRATIPQGAFYFFADFNLLADDLKRKGIVNSNALGQSLLKCPHHIATITGDAVMLRPEDYGARIAFVDYDGKEAFLQYKKNTPQTKIEEDDFVKNHAPLMIKGVDALARYVDILRK